MTNLAEIRAAADAVIQEYRATPTAENWDRVNAAQNAVSAAIASPIDRASYERQCHEGGVVPWSDDEIRQASYALRYADMPPRQTPQWLEFGLAKMRLAGIRAESPRQPPITMGTVAMVACSACGQRVPAAHLMSASRQSGVCPDCYDRLAD